MAEDGDAAARRCDRSSDTTKERRLSGTVRPTNGDTLTFAKLEAEVVDDVPVAEAAGDSIY
jgi:hypothetical protein